MAEDVKPTRKNLMEIEDRIQLSERGHDTLEQKRDGLIMEFMDILDQAQDVRQTLEADYEHAQETIDAARAVEGDVSVRGAAAALKEHPEITVESKNIMGVVVPQIESTKVKKTLDQRGYGVLGTSAHIDEAAEAYEDLLAAIVLAAEVETAMKKMLSEIETTKRRVNALEFKLLPDLYENQEYIQQKLEEQEREEIFRMKKVKAKKEREAKDEREAAAEEEAGEEVAEEADEEATDEEAAEEADEEATDEEAAEEADEEATDEEAADDDSDTADASE
jgi:V/A-type H+-transporting ATPase subunit D